MIKKSIPLGQRLINMGILSNTQLELALKLQKRSGKMLGEILANMGFISSEVLSTALAAQSNVKFVNLSRVFIDNEVIKLIPEKIARGKKLIPISLEDQTLTIAMENVFDVDSISALEKQTGFFINVVGATEEDIISSLDIYYSGGVSLEEIIEESINIATDVNISEESLLEEAPIVKLVNQIILKAIKDRATDIHIEPEESILRIRYRIDGIMTLGNTIPKSLQNPIIARIKIISEANIAETRKPQDGHIGFQMGKKIIDIRISFFPVIHGENVVMRLLDKSKLIVGLDKLGMSQYNINIFKKYIESSFGMILVCGPTGSGKTTTLYSALSYLNSLEKNIITLEDPVEYEFPIIRQSQVNNKIGLTFAKGLRTILRQDPDIILVGEMRDEETINMAVRASLTGHLVFSTIHTNDAISTISRMRDMGVPPYLISSSLILVVSQRLARKICPHCKEPMLYGQKKKLEDNSQYSEELFYHSPGCKRCNNTGYTGRIGIFEILRISEPIKLLIEEDAPTSQIVNQAKKEGFKTLFEDAVEKAQQGLTSFDEAVKFI